MIERVLDRVLLPFSANWITSPTVERVFQSEVESGVTGAESRGAMRQVPRFGVAWSVLPTTTEQRSRLDEILRTALREGEAATPFWGRGLKVGSGSTGTTLELAAEVPDSWVPFYGTVLWVARESDGPFAEDYELLTVASATGHTLELESAPASAVPEGSLVWPVIVGRFTGGEYEAVHGAVGVFKFAVRSTQNVPPSRFAPFTPEPSDTGVADPYDPPSIAWPVGGYGGEFSLSATTTDETVTSSIGSPPTFNADGTIELTFVDGVGPYFVEVSGYGIFPGEAGPTFSLTGLSQGEYEFTVTDSESQVATLTVRVYREAFDTEFNVTATKALTATDWTSTLNFDQWNPAFGTLLSVECVEVSWTIRSNGRIENVSGTGGTVTHGSTGGITLRDPASNIIATDTAQKVFTHTLAAYDGLADYGGSSGVSAAAGNTSKTTAGTSVSGSLAAFVGTGTVGLSASGTATNYASGPGSYIQANSPQVGGTFILTYTGHADRA